MRINKDKIQELLKIISDTIYDIIEIKREDELFKDLTNTIYKNVITYMENNLNEIIISEEKKLLKEKEEEIKQLKEDKDEKINITYPNDINNFINEVKILNERINKEYNDYVYQSLINDNFIKECINTSAMKSYYNKLLEILKNYKIDDKILLNLSNEIIMIFISPNVKASIRGARLNNIIDEIIINIPEINNDRFKISFENQPINIKCPERPDFVILDKSNNKEIVGYSQVELWNGMKNRADKYIRYNPHDNIFILCVVARKAVIEYKYPTKNTRNVKYEVFKYGYDHNKVCYVNNLQNIICNIFNIPIINDNININDIVDRVVLNRLNKISNINDNVNHIIDREDLYLQQNKRIEERNHKKEFLINGGKNFNSKKNKPLDLLKNSHFHFVYNLDNDFDIAILRNTLNVGQPFLNNNDFIFNVNKHLILKCDIDFNIVFNNFIIIKSDLLVAARNKLNEGKTKPYITREDILMVYNQKFFIN